jgi:hypothetical protein
LGGPRSHDFVLIVITAGRPRNVETKQLQLRLVAVGVDDQNQN